jgi:hypothetical protein
MKTFKNFTAALANDGVTVTKGQVFNGVYFDPNSDVDYQLVNNNSSTHNTPMITKRTWICDGPVSILEKDLQRTGRVRRVFVSNQLHTVVETKEQRIKNRTGSYTLRKVQVESNVAGVGYFGDYVITDYSIDEATQTARVEWTNVEYL